jgi:hypothetical protein
MSGDKMRGVLGFVLNLEQVAAGELKVLSVSTTPNGQFMKLQLVSELILSSAAFEIVPMQQEARTRGFVHNLVALVNYLKTHQTIH